MNTMHLAWAAACILLFSFSVSSADEEGQQQTRSQTPLILFPMAPAGEAEADDAASADEIMDNLVEVEPAIETDGFVIYVVRHAEKEDTQLDPGLTADGQRRAEALAQMLSAADIKHIYSTHYRRAATTALPLSRALALPVEFYQADEGDDLAHRLIEQQRTALVVGHSNTVPDLVNALGGSAESMSEETYGDVFQLLIRYQDDEVDVHQLHLIAPLMPLERRRPR